MTALTAFFFSLHWLYRMCLPAPQLRRGTEIVCSVAVCLFLWPHGLLAYQASLSAVPRQTLEWQMCLRLLTEVSRFSSVTRSCQLFLTYGPAPPGTPWHHQLQDSLGSCASNGAVQYHPCRGSPFLTFNPSQQEDLFQWVNSLKREMTRNMRISASAALPMTPRTGLLRGLAGSRLQSKGLSGVYMQFKNISARCAV